MPGLRDWVIGAVGVATAVTVLLPRNNSTRIISAMGDSQASLIKAAMGTGPGPGTNRERETSKYKWSVNADGTAEFELIKKYGTTPAETFRELAEQTIHQFWKGFTNDLD